MPLIQQRVGRVLEKVVKIHQEQGTLQAMLAVMVPQVLGQASVMEMQAAAFLAGMEAAPLEDKALFTLALYTGMRRGELLGEPGFQALREQIQRLMFTL